MEAIGRAVKLNATQHLDDHLLAIVRNAESLGVRSRALGLRQHSRWGPTKRGLLLPEISLGLRAEVILRVELFPKGYCIHWASTWSLSSSNKIFTGVSEVLLTRV